ncbi:hypothetical protein [Clostridium rectalis]|uniref:hypothetical protein n=1 Tax=Clostridium rectalis TaxID=2040295 RepID=UPI000F6329FA|nr:hypothetical protein [Clostridium rectalis]
MKECTVCGKPNSECHHIVFKSQQKALEHCKYNYIYLCKEHHTGNNSPHKNRQIDVKYKLIFQNMLFEKFTNKDYTEEGIKEILNISNVSVKRLVKIIDKHIDRYKKEDIIRACMGGKLY